VFRRSFSKKFSVLIVLTTFALIVSIVGHLESERQNRAAEERFTRSYPDLDSLATREGTKLRILSSCRGNVTRTNASFNIRYVLLMERCNQDELLPLVRTVVESSAASFISDEVNISGTCGLSLDEVSNMNKHGLVFAIDYPASPTNLYELIEKE
jgi:hypothetical protein